MTAGCGGTPQLLQDAPQGGSNGLPKADANEPGEVPACVPKGQSSAGEEYAGPPDARWLASVVTCFRPLRAWQDENDRVVFKGGRPDRRLDLPCGQCVGCRSSWSSMWMIRCVHESLMYERSSFITLTFDQDHVPKNWSIDKRHWQLFAKRLRHATGPFRYFAAGEYGSVNNRPHYHALLFGVDFDDRVLLKSHPRPLWTSAVLAEKWGQGHVSFGALTPQSVAYVTQYSLKKQKQRRIRKAPRQFVDFDTGELLECEPERVWMSRRPGLGSSWFEKYHRDVYPMDEVVVAGRKYRPPRFYDGRLSTLSANGAGVDGPGVLELIKDARRRSSMERCQDKTPARLAVREKVMEARLRPS